MENYLILAFSCSLIFALYLFSTMLKLKTDITRINYNLDRITEYLKEARDILHAMKDEPVNQCGFIWQLQQPSENIIEKGKDTAPPP